MCGRFTIKRSRYDLERVFSVKPKNDHIDERLHRAVMKAYYGAGNSAGVRSAMHRLTSLLEDDLEPVDSVNDETRRLYESLTSNLASTEARSAR